MTTLELKYNTLYDHSLDQINSSIFSFLLPLDPKTQHFVGRSNFGLRYIWLKVNCVGNQTLLSLYQANHLFYDTKPTTPCLGQSNMCITTPIDTATVRKLKNIKVNSKGRLDLSFNSSIVVEKTSKILVRIALVFQHGRLIQAKARRDLSLSKVLKNYSGYLRVLSHLDQTEIQGNNFIPFFAPFLLDIPKHLSSLNSVDQQITLDQQIETPNFPSWTYQGNIFSYAINNYYFRNIEVVKNVITIILKDNFRDKRVEFDKQILGPFLIELKNYTRKDITLKNILESDPLHKDLHDQTSNIKPWMLPPHTHISFEGIETINVRHLQIFLDHLVILELIEEEEAKDLKLRFQTTVSNR